MYGYTEYLDFYDKHIFKFFKVHITYFDSKKNNYLNTPHNNFLETVQFYNDSIKNIDFDIALLSCGSYAHFIGEYIKNIGKKSIYIGGVLPLYFGIFGDRYMKSFFNYFDYNYCVLNNFDIDHNHDKESLNDYLYNANKYDSKNINHKKYEKLLETLNMNNYQGKLLLCIFMEKKGGIPDNFNPDVYVKLNGDLKNLTKLGLVMHYLNHGRIENRKYIE